MGRRKYVEPPLIARMMSLVFGGGFLDMALPFVEGDLPAACVKDVDGLIEDLFRVQVAFAAHVLLRIQVQAMNSIRTTQVGPATPSDLIPETLFKEQLPRIEAVSRFLADLCQHRARVKHTLQIAQRQSDRPGERGEAWSAVQRPSTTVGQKAAADPPASTEGAAPVTPGAGCASA